MADCTCFATVWTKLELIHSALASKVVQRLDVGIGVVYVVDIWWILLRGPVLWRWCFHVEEHSLGLGLVID